MDSSIILTQNNIDNKKVNGIINNQKSDDFEQQKVREEYLKNKEKVILLLSDVEGLDTQLTEIFKNLGVITRLEAIKIESILGIINSREELKYHFENYIKCVELLNKVLVTIEHLCEVSKTIKLKGGDEPLFERISGMVGNIKIRYDEFIKKSDLTIHEIHHGVKNEKGELINGIDQLKIVKTKTIFKKNLLTGGSIGAITFSGACLVGGIVLSPITGGLSLFGTAAGVAATIGGGTSTFASIALLVLGNKYYKGVKKDLKQSIEILENFSNDIKSVIDIFEKNKQFKEKVQKEFDILFDHEIKQQRIFCAICDDICEDPVLIPHPDYSNYDIYCRKCITTHYQGEINNKKEPLLPLSRYPYSLNDFQQPDIATIIRVKQLRTKVISLRGEVNTLFEKKK